MAHYLVEIERKPGPAPWSAHPNEYRARCSCGVLAPYPSMSERETIAWHAEHARG
jgi:hypothetical protein